MVEQLKENMFFVVTGVIVLLCIVFYFNPFFSVRSWEARNAEATGEVEKLENQLDAWLHEKITLNNNRVVEGRVLNDTGAMLTVKTKSGELEQVLLADVKEMTPGKFIPNESAIAASADYHKRYVMMFDGGTDDKGQGVSGVKDVFRRMVLSTRLPGLMQPSHQDNPEVFLNQYRKLIDGLMQEIKDNDIKTENTTWAFWNWGGVLPAAAVQRTEATQEYWLTREILDVVEQKSLNVYSLDRLEIDPGAERNEKYTPRPWQRRGDYFDAIPFVLEVKMRFQEFPELVGKLLTTRTPVNIEAVSIGRLTEEQRGAMRGRKVPEGVLVNVKLTCVALNYHDMTPATGGGAVASKATGGAGGAVPTGGRPAQ